MLKKLIVVGAVAAVAVVAVRKTHFFGYAKQEMSSLREWADSQVPIEKKIAQLRDDVAKLDKDIDRAADALAVEIVEVKELAKKTEVKRAALEAEKKEILAHGEALKDATERVKYGTQFVSVPEAKERLKRDVDLHTKRKAELGSLEKTLSYRERIKETLEKQLDGLKTQKREMTAEIDAVEAQFKELQLQQIESRYQNDDTRLSKVKEQLRELQKKVDIEKTKLELAPTVRAEKPAASPTESVDDILAPLNGQDPAKIGDVK